MAIIAHGTPTTEEQRAPEEREVEAGEAGQRAEAEEQVEGSRLSLWHRSRPADYDRGVSCGRRGTPSGHPSRDTGRSHELPQDSRFAHETYTLPFGPKSQLFTC